MLTWRIDEVMILLSFNECTMIDTLQIFGDNAMNLFFFNEDYNSDHLARVVVVMNNLNLNNIDVWCPWSCPERCRDIVNIPFDITVQIFLPRLMLPLFIKSSKYRLVWLIWEQYLCEVDYYSKILLNGKWIVKPSIFFYGYGVQVLIYNFHNGGQ